MKCSKIVHQLKGIAIFQGFVLLFGAVLVLVVCSVWLLVGLFLYFLLNGRILLKLGYPDTNVAVVLCCCCYSIFGKITFFNNCSFFS